MQSAQLISNQFKKLINVSLLIIDTNKNY